MAENNAEVKFKDGTRKTYLITLSQADLVIVPSKEEFAQRVVSAFETKKVKVEQ